MKKVLLIISFATFLVAAHIYQKRWKTGETLLTFFEKHNIPQKIYYNLDTEAKELADEIKKGMRYYIALDSNGTLEQFLVPINEELQIHLFRQKSRYKLEFIPIFYQIKEDNVSLPINSNPYTEILHTTKNLRLAHEFVAAFKNSLDFSHAIRKGDKLAIIYKQKLRLGEFFGMPVIEAAVVETHKKKNYIFNFQGRYYDEKGKELESFLLKRPIRHARITSKFTRRRWHPVLHRYRAHLGVDFGARRGTPVMAAGSGRVVFAGRKGGYGNVIIIAHRGGYRTLYAHLSKFRRGIRRGRYVKQGQVIAYVGSTGLSTGPHLHFGLYKNGVAINPLRVVHVAKSRLYGKKLKQFQKMVKIYKKRLQKLLKKPTPPKIEVLSTNKIVSLQGKPL